VKWLNSLNCLPVPLKQRYVTNQLQLSEFANSLRDGELLCNLANQLIPGCIDTTLINKRSQMSQLLCLNNIRLFLTVCKSAQYFNLDESELFDEHMLYDLTDLACVIRTLSLISRSKLTNKAGFRLSTDNKENNDLSSISKQISPKNLDKDTNKGVCYINLYILFLRIFFLIFS
jgi:hypothetical protein